MTNERDLDGNMCCHTSAWVYTERMVFHKKRNFGKNVDICLFFPSYSVENFELDMTVGCYKIVYLYSPGNTEKNYGKLRITDVLFTLACSPQNMLDSYIVIFRPIIIITFSRE